MKTQTLLKIILLATSMSLMTACGAKKISTAESTDLASRITDLDSGNKAVAECNVKSDALMKVQLMSYKDASGMTRPEAVRMYLSNIDEAFESGNYTLRFFRWKANSNNEIYFDSTPLEVRVEQKSTLASVTGYIETLNWKSLQETMAANSSPVATIADFESKYAFVVDLKDFTADYDALKVAIYNGNTKVKDLDLLIPAFYANPTDYKASHGSVLYGIHPFYGQESSNWDNNHFSGILQEACF